MEQTTSNNEYLIERDISWLYFNHRVLQEAMDERVPLYERIKFLAIYSSNLDEFVQVRVASLRRFGQMKKATRKELLEEVKPRKTLKKVNQLMAEQLALFGKIYETEIIPALEREGVFVVKAENYSKSQIKIAEQFFEEKLQTVIRPYFLVEQDLNLLLENKALYFVVDLGIMTPPAIVVIPSEQFGRFVVLDGGRKGLFVTFLDDILRYNIQKLFPNNKVENCYSIKVSRDAELYLEDEYEGDLVEQIRRNLKRRDIGLVTRFLYDAEMPETMVNTLRKKLGIKKNDLVPGARYHNFNDFFAFPIPENRPDLENIPLPPLPHPELEITDSIIALLQQQDIILHFPYQSFGYIPKLLLEAAEDELVESIRITFYRVAAKSAVAQALLKAVENGKQVTVFIEVKARFDEASNLYWGEKLKEAGAKVIYSFPAIKVHTKLFLISREEEGRLRHYAYIGTGNFNEKTAKIYGDHAILTANVDLTKEIRQVFYLLERKILLPKTEEVLISPFSTRRQFSKLIRREIKNKQAGKVAYMILKMNSLEDSEMIEKLVEASQAGVKVQLIIRGICRLVPGLEGYTENIEIISIIDRFLEHARIYVFCNGGNEKMYVSSADWMTRNLDRRVEVAVPVKDAKVFKELRDIIDLQLLDNVKARQILPEQSNAYVDNKDGKVRSQAATYQYLERRSRRSVAKE
ncbi:MAG: polyphosphate kinase 1 [Bacteroidota bacterium]